MYFKLCRNRKPTGIKALDLLFNNYANEPIKEIHQIDGFDYGWETYTVKEEQIHIKLWVFYNT